MWPLLSCISSGGKGELVPHRHLLHDPGPIFAILVCWTFFWGKPCINGYNPRPLFAFLYQIAPCSLYNVWTCWSLLIRSAQWFLKFLNFITLALANQGVSGAVAHPGGLQLYGRLSDALDAAIVRSTLDSQVAYGVIWPLTIDHRYDLTWFLRCIEPQIRTNCDSNIPFLQGT